MQHPARPGLGRGPAQVDFVGLGVLQLLVYRNFKQEFDRLHNERVNAFKEYIKDVEEKKFDDSKITVGINEKEYDNFLNLVDKI